MGEAGMYMRVPIGTTDEQLVEILEKTLPDHLVRTMHINPIRAKGAARELAMSIVYKARQNNQAYLVPDVATRMSLSTPTQNERDAFQAAVAGSVVVRYGDVTSHRSWVKDTSGKLWYLLRERVLGLPPEADDASANAAVGVRG